ncbi:MAG: PadR family transcriptional regulator [Candidatus Helarchaeota archaeon]
MIKISSSENQDLIKQKPDLAPTHIVLLLIINEKPIRGYEINKILEEREFHNWVDIKLSTMYKSLGILEKEGYIKSEMAEKIIKSSKKIYLITAKGKKKLKQQIESCIKYPPKPKSMFDLGLAGIYLLSKKEALLALESYKMHLIERITFLKRKIEELINENKNHEHFFIIKALFERPLLSILGQKEWLETFIQSIKMNSNLDFKDEVDL